MKSVFEKYCPWIPLLVLCVWYTYKAIAFPIHDFSNYYFGGKILANGHFTTDIYFPYWFNTEVSSLGYSGLFTNYAPNTPFLALVFYPISFVSLAVAKLIFNTISVLLFLFSMYRLTAHYKIKPIYVALLPILFFVPIKNELLFGQVYFLLFFLLVETLLAYEKEQFKKMAFLLSVAILLKVFPVFVVLLFVFKKQFKPLFYTVAFCLFLFGITLVVVDFDVWLFYFQMVLPKASNGEIATSFVDNYQSVFMFLKRLFVYETVENRNAFLNAPIVFSVLVLIFKLVLIGIGFYVSRKVSNSLMVFSYWILTAILISPYGSTYIFILLLLPFLGLLKSELSNVKKGAFIVLLVVINNFPLRYFIEKPFAFSYLRLLFLMLFFGLLISLFYKMVNWKLVALVAILPLLLLFNDSKTILSNYVLDKKTPILLYDFKIENNKLTYWYWNENGENSESIPFSFQSKEALSLKNNQIYYKNKVLTSDKSNKLKPMLIDAKTVLYLSDYDRGIGFYTLRKIELN